MSLFNQMIRGNCVEGCDSPKSIHIISRTFKETIQDQILFHQNKIADLEAVRDSLSPDVEKFVEAIQRIG
jgi:hypothetical protein